MQFVILCGGLGSRAQSFSKGKPKSMIEFKGKPFIDYSISNLISQGISRFVLCVGKGGESIVEYCEKHFSSKVEILFSWERDHLLGTGGAVKKAKYLLDDEFLLSYGDAYVLIDVQNFIFNWKNRKDCVMSLKRADVKSEANVVFKNGKVKKYNKLENEESKYLDYGLLGLSKYYFNDILESSFDLKLVLDKIIEDDRLSGFRTTADVYEIGSLRGFKDFKKFSTQVLK